MTATYHNICLIIILLLHINYSVEDIVSAASTEYHLPSKFVVLFSTKSRFYITGQNALTQQQFKELLNDAGGAEGHALLYLLPITQLSPDKVISDYSCIAPLSESKLMATNLVLILALVWRSPPPPHMFLVRCLPCVCVCVYDYVYLLQKMS